MTDPLLSGAELISLERKRQREAENFEDSGHDQLTAAELPRGALNYLALYCLRVKMGGRYDEAMAPFDRGFWPAFAWPWHASWWKPKDPIRDLTRAGAMIAAEIDRLQRLKLASHRGESGSWTRCPSTHCERRGECGSPSDCHVKRSGSES